MSYNYNDKGDQMSEKLMRELSELIVHLSQLQLAVISSGPIGANSFFIKALLDQAHRDVLTMIDAIGDAE